MAALAGTAVEVDALLLHFLGGNMEVELFAIDPVIGCFGAAALVELFWKEVERQFGYASATPSLRGFAVSIFRGANPLDDPVTLHPHSEVFLQRWKDSQSHSASFRQWSHQMEKELQIATALGGVDERKTLGDCDTFEVFEKFTLHRLCESFANGATAMELRELLASAELTVDSVAGGVSRYVASCWRIDLAYQRCTWNLRRYGQVQVIEQITQWVEKSYVNNFLLPLADRWSDQVRGSECWACPGVSAQRRFFKHYVQPFLSTAV